MSVLSENPITHSVAWRSPSNIALVKYWGKYGQQYPQNPSVSFTLSQSYTETQVSCRMRDSSEKGKPVSFDFVFHGQANPAFALKIEQFLNSQLSEFPFLSDYHLQISSSNSFPHSSGIASSASGMSALTLCLCSLDKLSGGVLANRDEAAFFQKASRISRLGSGSACRSLYPQAALWGTCSFLDESSQDYAIPYQEYLHPVFHNYCDTILIVSRREKSVSSRAGHGLMEQHPYSSVRYQQANKHLEQLHRVLQTADLEGFIDLVELEALELHALMMSSSPSFILMQPNTLAVIAQIRRFRQETGCPICFTLDAGPNVHVLYPQTVKAQAEAFIKETLLTYCEDQYCIWDCAGNGPVQII